MKMLVNCYESEWTPTSWKDMDKFHTVWNEISQKEEHMICYFTHIKVKSGKLLYDISCQETGYFGGARD